MDYDPNPNNWILAIDASDPDLLPKVGQDILIWSPLIGFEAASVEDDKYHGVSLLFSDRRDSMASIYWRWWMPCPTPPELTTRGKLRKRSKTSQE